MCVSTHVFEQRALDITEQIQNKSVYKFVRAEFIDGKRVEFQKQQSNGSNAAAGKYSPLITKVFLEDKDGRQYSIEPDPNGLRFAEGKITYEEYKNLQRNENSHGLRLFCITISGYILGGGALIWYLF
ncbi:hypothetical protein B1B05_09030 [Domibacillus enclensis]|uniref:Uncharacterized protein n=1 Tax=Domibacillus enclensis TaxID=1017273 RepID=A0A1N6V899_9BACI|nr:hypothetical protein B1B05_09030 [Domibacillus enclensis]SIQ74008.1 hypothetical protein SAMN05443094_103482 [Domibacillus enclensis]